MGVTSTGAALGQPADAEVVQDREIDHLIREDSGQLNRMHALKERIEQLRNRVCGHEAEQREGGEAPTRSPESHIERLTQTHRGRSDCLDHMEYVLEQITRYI